MSITGTLSNFKRKDAVQAIENCGAQFVNEINYQTNYLVSTRFDTVKAKKAKEIGVQIISESEFSDFIEIGLFLTNEKPEAPERHYPNNFPKPDWKALDNPKSVSFEYVNADGEIKLRNVIVIAVGSYTTEKGGTRHYLQAFEPDTQSQKTFRMDRIFGELPKL